MTLTLNGTAVEAYGSFVEGATQVIRLRSATSDVLPTCHDYTLIKSMDDVVRAQAKGFMKCVLIAANDDLNNVRAEADALVVLPQAFNYLENGDIVALNPKTRRVRTLYRSQSAHNSFLVTDRCNHYCLMCSQPPKRVDDRWILDEIRTAIPLVDSRAMSLGFTGGEPLLEWNEFVDILRLCRDRLPNTALHILSNGRAFAKNEVVDAWAGVEHPDLMVGIPLYSADDYTHNYVVQAASAFDETVLGILKLKDRRQRVELRVVLHAVTAPQLRNTCAWIARNLPFVDHVALMGLENTGFAIANADLLWVDPVEYSGQLSAGVEEMVSAGLRVSIYNLQRCILPRSLWRYAVQSISDWKNGYLPECDACAERPNCAGFFTSGRPRHSFAIKPILAS